MSSVPMSPIRLMDQVRCAEAHRSAGRFDQAILLLSDIAGSGEEVDPEICLRLAQCFQQAGDFEQCARWLIRLIDAGESFTTWTAAAALLDALLANHVPTGLRRVSAMVLGSYTLVQLAPLLRLAALRHGIALEVRLGQYGQYRQEILDPQSDLYADEPDVVILSTHAEEVALPALSTSPDEDLARELQRWQTLWETLSQRSRARILMHNFAIPPDDPLGHLSCRLPGSRSAMIQKLNLRLGEAAGPNVVMVDCEKLSAIIGKRHWFDERYWHLAKQAVALEALPLLAKHTAAVMAADLGLSRKCVVLDLDNTLWGGIVGEDGLNGIRLGHGDPAGEAYLAFQRHLKGLKDKGILLAVCSRNNPDDVREVFENHPEMLLRIDDFAVVLADWEPKPDNLRRIAQTLNIGLDSLVFVDDNPAEREAVRRMLPQVEVVSLSSDPALYVRALSQCLSLETRWRTSEDAGKTEEYRARARAAVLQAGASSLEDFYHSLDMRAVIAPFDEMTLPRIVQLIGKTNQFNLTTRRHSLAAIRGFMSDHHCVHFSLTLSDRLGDHGLVAVMIARKAGRVMDIDTWLMSCRVIGRTVEATMLSELSRRALEMGCGTIRATYLPTSKNAQVRDVLARLGFVQANGGTLQSPNHQIAKSPDRQIAKSPNHQETWSYDLNACGVITNEFIESLEPQIRGRGRGRGAAVDVA